MTKPSNVKALETGTGISWEEWVAYLDFIHAKELGHSLLAQKILEKIVESGKSESPEWWAQSAAVAYERHVGTRKPGQTCDGNFSVTVSKTIDGDMDYAIDEWMKRVDGLTEFNGFRIVREGLTSQTEKWRYWRCRMEDGSNVSVNIQNKPNGKKSIIAINHDKLRQAEDVGLWRVFWKSFNV